MHATNNGPVILQEDIKNGTLHPFNNNLEEFKAAGIPYARTHDTSFYHRFGQEHVIDVYYIFPNFDAGPYDPENYDFACTDHYILGCEMAGVETFYRLGDCVKTSVAEDGTYICAAKNESAGAVLFIHFNDNDSTEAKTVSIDMTGFVSDGGVEVEYFILDAAMIS